MKYDKHTTFTKVLGLFLSLTLRLVLLTHFISCNWKLNSLFKHPPGSSAIMYLYTLERCSKHSSRLMDETLLCCRTITFLRRTSMAVFVWCQMFSLRKTAKFRNTSGEKYKYLCSQIIWSVLQEWTALLLMKNAGLVQSSLQRNQSK